MQLKRYTFASIILMILVGVATYMINKETISFDLFGIHFPNLPIAIWVVFPVVLMYLASIMHMAYHALLGNLKLRKLTRDGEKMIDSLRDALLGVKDRNNVYKSDTYRIMGKLIDNSSILPFNTLKEVGDINIDEALQLLRDVADKKKVDIKKFHLANSTSLVIQNNLNRLERNEINADEVLARPDTYGDVVCLKAYDSYVKTASVGSILKYKQLFTMPSLEVFVARINSAFDGIEMSNDELIVLLKSLHLNSDNYIDLSIALSKNMLPEQRIRLFESLSENNDEAMSGYFYTLYDLQMIDTANEILNNTAKDDYLIFKAYRDLKRANKHYDIALFLRK